MFGYRLVREHDWERLHAQMAALEVAKTAAHGQLLARMEDAHADRAALDQKIIDLTAQASSRASLVDLLTARVNVLEHENAQFRQRTTGMPAMAPQIGVGNPMLHAQLGTGVDMFEDVGDAAAQDLQERHLLHDEREALPQLRAESATAGFVGGE